MRIAIIDDEEAIGAQIENLVKNYSKKNNVIADTVRYNEAVSFLENYNSDFDVIFLDIKMPKLNGMRAAEMLRAKDNDVIIVFVTNLRQYAICGYSVDAIGFVVKPIDEYDFTVLMDKVVRRFEARRQTECTIKTAEGLRRIRVRDIDYIEIIKHKLIYHTTLGDIASWGSLVAVESELYKEHFSRCNVCYLVNLYRVQEINWDFVTVAGTPLKIARSRKKDFFADIAKFWGNDN